MESVSFESENHGLQVGINHGVISNRISHARVVQTTRTGAVFNGDISAGRDININYITKRAFTLYQSSLNAPTLFSQVQNDLGILHTILKHAQKLFEKGELDDDQSNSLKDVLRGCDEGFRDLKQLRERFDSIDAESQDNCERFGLGIEELRDIRERFTTYIQALNLLTTESMRSSQANIERLVAKLVGEVNSGKREGSVLSECSLGPEDKKSWREFRKELQSVGITPDLFRVHRSFIISKLRNSLDGFVVNEMDAVEEVEEDDDEAMEDAEEEIEDIDLSMGKMGRVTSTQRRSASLYKANGGQNRRSYSVNKPLPTEIQTPVQSSSLAAPFQNYDPPAEVSTDNKEDDFAMIMAYLDESTSLPQQKQRNKGSYYPNIIQSIAYLEPVSLDSLVAPQTSFEHDTTGNSRLNTGIFELDQSTSDFYQDNFSNSNFMAASPISEPTDQDMIDPHRMHIPLDMVVWDGSETPGTEAADTHLKSWGAPGDGLSKNLRPQGATFENVMAIPQLLNGPSTQLPSNDPSSMNVDDFIQSANESTAAAGQLRKANTAHSERTSSLHDDQTGDFQLYPNGLTVGDNSLFIQPPCVYQGSYNRRERPSIPKDGLRNSDDTRERNLHPTGSFAAGSQVSCPDSHDEPLSNRSVRLPPHSIPPPMHQTFEVPLPTEQIPLPGMLCRYQPTTTHVTQDDMLVQDDNHYFEEPSKSRYGRELRGSISPTVTSRNEAESSNADRLLLMYLAPSHPESCPDSPHSASIV